MMTRLWAGTGVMLSRLTGGGIVSVHLLSVGGASSLIRVGGMLPNLAAQIAIARLAPQEDVGTFLVVLGLAALGTYLATFSLGSVAQRFIPEYAVAGSRERVLGFHLFALRLAAALSVAMAAMSAACGLAAYLGGLPRFAIAAWLFGALLLPLAAQLILLELQRAAGRSVMAQFVASVVYPSLAVLAVLGVGRFATLDLLLLGLIYMCVAGLACSIQAFDLYRSALRTERSVRAAYEARRWIDAAAPLVAFNLLGAGAPALESLVVAMRVDPGAAAVYRIDTLLLSIMAVFHFTFYSAVGPKIAAHAIENAADAHQRFLRRITLIAFLPTFCAGAALILSRHEILAAFGPNYHEGAIPLVIMTSAWLIRYTFGPLNTLLTISGLGKWLTIGEAVGLSVSLAGAWIAAPYLSIVGVALAHGAACIVTTAILYTALVRRTNLRVALVHALLSRPST